jgi:hypothetical protein
VKKIGHLDLAAQVFPAWMITGDGFTFACPLPPDEGAGFALIDWFPLPRGKVGQ